MKTSILPRVAALGLAFAVTLSLLDRIVAVAATQHSAAVAAQAASHNQVAAQLGCEKDG